MPRVLMLAFWLSLSLQEDGLSPRDQELKDLKESLQDTQPVGVLVECCRTLDQVRKTCLLLSNKSDGVYPVFAFGIMKVVQINDVIQLTFGHSAG